MSVGSKTQAMVGCKRPGKGKERRWPGRLDPARLVRDLYYSQKLRDGCEFILNMLRLKCSEYLEKILTGS